MFGLLNELAGESGMVYTQRLTSTNKDGSPAMLAAKYGYTPEAAAAAEGKIIDSLHALDAQLVRQKAAGSRYFVGSSISVMDIYWATMCAMFSVPGEHIMPRTKVRHCLCLRFHCLRAKTRPLPCVFTVFTLRQCLCLAFSLSSR